MSKKAKVKVGKPIPSFLLKAMKEPLKIVDRRLNPDAYFGVPQIKKSVVLHHTGGTTAAGAISWWNQTPSRVATAFVIDRDGTLYRCFDESHWAYHLGVGRANHILDQESVGIEIVSAGQLRGDGMFYPLWPNTRGARKIPREEISEVSHKGYAQWHKYSNAQLKTLAQLLIWLDERFPTLTWPESTEGLFEYRPEVIQQRIPGLWTHNTFSKHKVDVFPQPELISLLEYVLAQINHNKKYLGK